MDFFEAQARARRRSGRLVALFALAVLGTIAALYTAALLIGDSAFTRADHRILRPELLGGVSVFTLLVCGVAALSRWSALRAGGPAVAERLGGRRVSPSTTDLRERTLLNVVEEMALASGLPVPAVYVLPDEPGVNAFAAGYSPADAAVAVTEGALDRLSRDELQGVVAHEFSHILNGDMRLNTRLSALVFGILALSVVGKLVFRSALRFRPQRSRGKDAAGGLALLLLILAAGLALLLIGYIGHLFGQLVQAAVSRQREFLADAAAVQFTRNPPGLAGALKRIGGAASGALLDNPRADEIGHFCFAQNFSAGFAHPFATHPPLHQRIRAIDPAWDGRFLPTPAAPTPAPRSATAPPHQPAASSLAPGRPRIDPAELIGAFGQISPAVIRAEREFLAALPDQLRAATRDPAQIAPLCFALCLPHADDPTELTRLLDLISRHADAATARQSAALLPSLAALPADHHLSLLQLAAPTLRRLDPDAAANLTRTLDVLVRSDGRTSIREFALQRVVARTLDLAARPRDSLHVLAPNQVAPELSTALSVAARAEAPDPPSAAQAFARAAAGFAGLQPPLAYRATDNTDWDELDDALEHLAHTPAPFRRRILQALATALTADSRLSAAEADLLRAFAAALDCPLPPLLPLSP
jgi:Zn-dependent protease with chaperone function